MPVLEAAEVAYRGTQPPRASRTEPLPAELHPLVAERLASRGVDGLYAHQAETWEAVARGESVVVSTGTASGKSLAFSLPVLDAIARDPSARAVFLYPTKALAQDQARWLASLGIAGLRPAIYDGDTPIERRSHIRRTANVILTNPDMLHVGVLPHHDRWGDALHNLRLVVVDEAHVYRGIFGSHVGNVLRRLRRLALAYDADPVFVLASATIANAGELATRLTGLDVRVVSGDTAPQAEREVVLWNPELLDAELGTRASALGDASRLLAGLVGARPAHDLLHEEPQGGGARAPLRERPARRGDRGAARSVPRRATRPSSAARSSGGSSRASCSGSPRRRRSSSGSTSARSTARSPSASPAPSPRSGSSGDAPVAGAGASRSSSRARMRSTSSSCRSPRRCSGEPRRPR